MSSRHLVATDSRDSCTRPLDFETIHTQGIPHRTVHVGIVNGERQYFVWSRKDGRLEIPGGHVDWLTEQDRPESYEEAALRETSEELELLGNWGLGSEGAYARLKAHLVPLDRIVNQIPSSHGNNNEWVTVYLLSWQRNWGDPCDSGWRLSAEGKSPQWLSVDEIERLGTEQPMSINAALRLFLRRRGILAPLMRDKFPES